MTMLQLENVTKTYNGMSIPVHALREVDLQIAEGDFEQRVLVTSRDEIGRLATTINDMADKLAALSEARNQFFSKVSHELRTPLTHIKGFAITLLRQDDLDSQARRRLNIINDQTDRLTRLVDDLLDLARLDVGQLALECEETDIVRLVSDVVRAYHLQAQQKIHRSLPHRRKCKHPLARWTRRKPQRNHRRQRT